MHNQMDVYLEEYSSEDALRRYTSKTAGHGINYLLEHDYAEIYLSAIKQFLKPPAGSPLKILEFGCGAGMNVLTLLSLLERNNIEVDAAYGTDFSEKLIKAANEESKALLNSEQQEKVHFVVARSEQLVSDLARGLDKPRAELVDSFHMILGVNTFRYCHRLGKARESAQDIADLLAPGGICIMIDMNNKFPVFRSRLHDRMTKPENERYLPSLDEYASPFAEVGLEVLRKENFSWIPHSASPTLTKICRLATPLLNGLFRPFAMRSLVVCRKSP
jgi:SAM-dependent methyltransferase